VDCNVDDLDRRLADVKERLAALRAERTEKANAVKAIDPGFLLYYERLSTARDVLLFHLKLADHVIHVLQLDQRLYHVHRCTPFRKPRVSKIEGHSLPNPRTRVKDVRTAR